MSTPRRTVPGMTTCAAYGCCEPAANEVCEFCDRHVRDVGLFDQWLRGCLPVAGGGGVLRVKDGDPRSSFDVARAGWARRPVRP